MECQPTLAPVSSDVTMASGIDYPKNTLTKNQPDGINHNRGRRLGMGVDALSVTRLPFPPPRKPFARWTPLTRNGSCARGACQRQRGVRAGAVEPGLKRRTLALRGKATVPLRWLLRLEATVPPGAPGVALLIPHDRSAVSGRRQEIASRRCRADVGARPVVP